MSRYLEIALKVASPAQTIQHRDRPPTSLEVERRFSQPHAKLFLFIGRKVRTPRGPGTLVQVFAERVTVLLDADLEKCSWFGPGEIEPVS